MKKDFFTRFFHGPFRKKHVSGEVPSTPPVPGREAQRDIFPSGRTESGTLGQSRNWSYIGDDDEGTPIYLDMAGIEKGPVVTPAWVRLKHIPPEGSPSLARARQYLAESGRNASALRYIEQLVEIDPDRNLVADVALFFFGENERIIEKVEFREKQYQPLDTEAVYTAIKSILSGHTRPEPDSVSAEPEGIDERIGLKLQEINRILEAFDGCGGTESESPKK